jgi:hypothetical protein
VASDQQSGGVTESIAVATQRKRAARAPKAKADDGQPAQVGPTQKVRLDSIVPYWRNPRLIPEEAVASVASSIAAYGYLQPIVVDEQGIIITGHTRYMALRRLGYDEVPVRVAIDLGPEQVKALRVMDNKVREFTSWQHDMLTDELADLDSDLMRAFFPEAGATAAAEAAQRESDLATRLAGDEPTVRDVEFVCPQCFHQWEMPVSKEAILSGRLALDSDSNQKAEASA